MSPDDVNDLTYTVDRRYTLGRIAREVEALEVALWTGHGAIAEFEARPKKCPHARGSLHVCFACVDPAGFRRG